MSTELEYKFSLPAAGPTDIEELRAALESAGYTLHGPERLEQQDRYFDGRRRHLARAGVALRRREVVGRRLATFKGAQRGGGALFEREELELPLEPDGGWPAAVARRAAEYGPLHSLRPVLELTTRRTRYRVGRGGTELAELAFDEVSAGLPGGEMRAHFGELELEALGPADALGPLAELLQQVLALTPNTASKLERAEALLSLASELSDEP